MRKGFTLVELLVSMSIFTVIIGAVYLSFTTGLSAREKAETGALISQQARIAMDRISSDLKSAFTLQGKTQTTYPFEGMDKQETDTPGDMIRFTTLSYNKDFKEIVPKKVTYYIEQDIDRLLPILKRKEEDIISIHPKEEGKIVIDNVWGLDFAFCSKDGGWLDSWGQEDLPRMVRVTITMGNPKNIQIREDFITAVALSTGYEFYFK